MDRFQPNPTNSEIIPKKEPKLEEAANVDVPPIPLPAIPKTPARFSPDPIHSILQTLSPNIADEGRSFLHFPRRSPRLHPCPNPNPSRKSTALVPFKSTKKHTPRSSDLKRVTLLSPEEAVRRRSLVRQRRILYESLRLRLLHEEEESRRLPSPGTTRSRTDMTPGTMMREADLWLNRDDVRIVGLIPGIHIGDVFFYRMELCVIGLHGQTQAGIDYLTSSSSPTGQSIATSIIVSDGYEDDLDKGDALVYTGSGGRKGKHAKKNSRHQKLEGGNLALEGSYKNDIEIRVIRGMSCDRSPSGKLCVYDGLYKIEQYETVVGISGFDVYKFYLVRIPGQEEMGSALVKLAAKLKKNPDPARYLSPDISKGKEKEPVAVVNDFDERQDPLRFDYQVRPAFNHFIKGLGGSGCHCVSDCRAGCACVKRNGGNMAYDSCGRLLRGRPLLYECGKHCGCPSSCMNRVTHKGLTHRLQVFRSEETGWGVRSLDLIQAGEFVCEFSGIMRSREEAELAPKKDAACLLYPSIFPKRWKEWGDLSAVRSDPKDPEFPSVPDVCYAVDVLKARNVACYISHSCNPNVFIQFVLRDHYSIEFPRMMVFAMETIPPMRELSLDYGILEV